MHRRIRDLCNTWRHRLSRGIANRARLLVLEKLNTQGMTSSGKGTVEQPGVNVRAKAGLNRSILATGWAELEQMLSYKTRVVLLHGERRSRQGPLRPVKLLLMPWWRQMLNSL